MNQRIVVREAPIEEALKVHATVVEFDGRPYTKERFEEKSGGRERLVIVGCVDGKPAGYLIAYDRYGDGSFYCWMAGVNPKFRRKGALKAMMDYTEKWAKKKGYRRIKIKTRNRRREMLAYLVKHGYQFVEVRQRPDARDSRILLEKQI